MTDDGNGAAGPAAHGSRTTDAAGFAEYQSPPTLMERVRST